MMLEKTMSDLVRHYIPCSVFHWNKTLWGDQKEKISIKKEEKMKEISPNDSLFPTSHKI